MRKLAAEVAQDGARARLPQKAVSVDDAALMLGVGRSTMYELMEKGRVRSAKVGSRRPVPVAGLDDFLAEADTGGS